MPDSKNKIQFIDDALHPNALSNHHLLLHLSPYSMAYSIYNPLKKNLAACTSYQKVNSQVELDLIFSKDPWLYGQYAQVKVMFTNHLFTFIPNELFEQQAIPSYLSFNLLEPDAFFQERNDLPRLEAQNIFCINREPKIVVNKYHPNNKVFHSSSPLIEGVLAAHSQSPGKRIFIFVWNENDMEIVAISDGKLLLYNHFQVNSDEEFIYFPLYVCQQLKFNRDVVEIIAGGILGPKSHAMRLLDHYFKHLHFSGLPATFNYSKGLAEHTGNLAWSLANLALCES